MSKLEELIQQYCPDGVEYAPLSSIGTIKRGNGLQKKDFVKSGVGCIHYGQIYTKFGAFAEKTLSFVNEELASHLLHIETGDLVIACTSENVEDVCKAVAWLGKETIVTGGHSCVLHHNQNPKYVAYFFQTESFQSQKRKHAYGTKVIDIKPDNIGKIVIPVPPLPVQEEIVRILDIFTELQAELQAELQKRKSQYSYYLDNLLSFNKWGGQTGVRWMKMSEVCLKISSGGTPTRKNGSYFKGDIPWLRTQEVDWNSIYDTEIKITEEAIKNSSAKLIPENCVIIAMYGATAGKAGINKIPLTTNQACCNLQINPQTALYEYVYYWVCKDYEKIKSLGQGSQNNINAQIVKDYPIPVPSLAEQKKIVSILDRFDRLTNDLSSGLPAEMKKRRQQYEYYRDKLLSFKRKGA